MLEYSLEFLANNGVQDIIIFCGTHANLITGYLECVTLYKYPHAPILRLV